MARNIILTGGIFHPFAEASRTLAAILGERGIISVVHDDIEQGLRSLRETGAELLTVYALRWSMTQHGKYAPNRARWAMSLSEEGRAAVVGHLRRGGAVLALHTAVICFDDWPEWGDILGARWKWGQSAHPPYGAVDVRITVAASPLTAFTLAFTLRDEVYSNLDFSAAVTPLAQARAARTQEKWQPVLWTRAYGGGRVAVDLLGHDGPALDAPAHRDIIQRAALWALGRVGQEMEKP